MRRRASVLRWLRLVRRPGGFLLLALAGASLGIHLWLARSVFVPIARDAGTEYVFVSATVGTFALAVLVSWAGLLLGHALLRWAGARVTQQPPLFTREDVEYSTPLFVFAASALGLLNLVPSVAGVLPVWSYLIVDLRWWWTLLVLVWVLTRIDRRLGGRGRKVAAHLRGWIMGRRGLPEATIVAIALIWVVAATPHLRFAGGSVGDERRYLRYCELIYQGLGFEISRIQPIADLPPDFRPKVWRNVTMLAAALPGDLRELAADAITFLGDPTHRFHRAEVGDAFVRGKNGGIYQRHNPGLSMLIFPAYYVDRRLAAVEPGSPAQFPAELPTVQAFQLALYALWAVVIFRFLRRGIGAAGPAWIATLLVVLTLPVAAFPFQYYPELPAGLLVSAVAGYLLFPSPRRAAPLLYGLLAGYLIWLHVRFALLAIVFAAAALILLRRDARRVVLFLAGFAVPVAAFSLHVYHATGSILPTALWYAEGARPVFSWNGMIRTSVAYLVDRDWGLFAISPVYLLALPGFWLMSRRWPAGVRLSAAAFLAVLVPSAGHTLDAAGTTPTRLIAAAVPLAATPMVDVLKRLDPKRLAWIPVALLAVLSLQNALAYNLHHARPAGRFIDWSFSGWNANLMFPAHSRNPWDASMSNGVLLILWGAGLLLLLAAPAVMARARARARAPGAGSFHRSRPTAILATVVAFGLLGTGVAAATGVWTRNVLTMPPTSAALRAARFLDTIGHCGICLTSSRGRVMTGTLLAELEGVGQDVAERRVPRTTRSRDEWVAMVGEIRAWYLQARGREPTSTETGHYLHAWRERQISPREIRRLIFERAGRPVPPDPARE